MFFYFESCFLFSLSEFLPRNSKGKRKKEAKIPKTIHTNRILPAGPSIINTSFDSVSAFYFFDFLLSIAIKIKKPINATVIIIPAKICCALLDIGPPIFCHLFSALFAPYYS